MNIMVNKAIRTLFSSTLLIACSTAAFADSTIDMIDTFVKNGGLTKEQGSMLIKSREKEIKNKAKVEFGKKGLVIKSPNKDFTMTIGGRLHVDYNTETGDKDMIDSSGNTIKPVHGTEIRRARINIKGTAHRDFFYQLETDFAGNHTTLKDAVLAYTGFEPFEITLGNQKPNMSMEIEESSNDIMFIERSLVSPLAFFGFDRSIGANVKASGHDWSAMAGFWGDGVNQNNKNLTEGHMWSARGSWAPINEKDQVLHLALGVGKRTSAQGNHTLNTHPTDLGYNTTNLSQFSLTTLTSGAKGKLHDNMQAFGMVDFELSGMYGPASFQSEFTRATVERETKSDINLNAYYMQVGYTLTGENRRYKGSDGEFKHLKANNDFDPKHDHWGAFEVAGRYDYLDMVDKDVNAGTQRRVTLALNWYLNDNFRLMTDWSRSYKLTGNAQKYTNGNYADDIDVYSMRGQWSF